MTNCVIKILTAGVLFASILLTGCNKEFDEYYIIPEQSTQKMWEIIKTQPDCSRFCELMGEAGLDTIFSREQPFTIFIPVNDAFREFDLEGDQLVTFLGYHLSEVVILPHHIKTYRKLQTLFGKFTLLERNENNLYFDGHLLSNSSPLYKDGNYYTLQEIAYPKPNLYEYINWSCKSLSRYIDLQDSIAFDPIESTPLGFDEEGNTIYDSVFSIVNRFERDFFPVREEFRDQSATMIVFTQEQYDEALDRMADNLGPLFTDHNDIPPDWQMESLMPYFLHLGVFPGVLTYENLSAGRIRNIQGDSVVVDYLNINPDSRYICSNGITFTYNSLIVPQNLYIDTLKLEGEDLIIKQGEGQYAWMEGISTNDLTKEPLYVDATSASEGAYLSVPLPRRYTESYYFEFIFPRIFPNRYRFIWRANYRPSGVIAFYVNDLYIGEFDNYNFNKPVDGSKPVNGFNQKEFLLEHISEYGDLKIRIEYTAPGLGTTNGVNLDYILLLPAGD